MVCGLMSDVERAGGVQKLGPGKNYRKRFGMLNLSICWLYTLLLEIEKCDYIVFVPCSLA